MYAKRYGVTDDLNTRKNDFNVKKQSLRFTECYRRNVRAKVKQKIPVRFKTEKTQRTSQKSDPISILR